MKGMSGRTAGPAGRSTRRLTRGRIAESTCHPPQEIDDMNTEKLQSINSRTFTDPTTAEPLTTGWFTNVQEEETKSWKKWNREHIVDRLWEIGVRIPDMALELTSRTWYTFYDFLIDQFKTMKEQTSVPDIKLDMVTFERCWARAVREWRQRLEAVERINQAKKKKQSEEDDGWGAP